MYTPYPAPRLVGLSGYIMIANYNPSSDFLKLARKTCWIRNNFGGQVVVGDQVGGNGVFAFLGSLGYIKAQTTINLESWW